MRVLRISLVKDAWTMDSPPTAFRTISIRSGAALALLAMAVGSAAGYAFARHNAPEATRIVATACGVAPAEAPFALPIGTIGEHAPHLPLMVGPINIDGRTAVLLRFDPTLDGTDDTVVRLGDVLHLPRTIGDRPSPPTEIRLNCRNGTLAAVQYHLEDFASSFMVVHHADEFRTPDS
jgi:hypothetical protein